MTSDELALWQDSADAFERHLQQIATRARATLADLGFPGHVEARATFEAVVYTPADAHDPKAVRDHERARAALTVLLRLQDLRRWIQPQALPAYEVLNALQAAVEVGTLANDAVLDRWLAHAYREGQAARARALSKLKHEQHTRESEQFRADLARLREQHPRFTLTAIARLIDPQHVDRIRKRIMRIDLLHWQDHLSALTARSLKKQR